MGEPAAVTVLLRPLQIPHAQDTVIVGGGIPFQVGVEAGAGTFRDAVVRIAYRDISVGADTGMRPESKIDHLFVGQRKGPLLFVPVYGHADIGAGIEVAVNYIPVTDEFVVADFRIVEGEDEFADSLFAVKESSHHGFVPDTQRVSLFGDAADGECNSCCDEARNDGPDDDFRPVHGKSLFFCEDTVFRRERQRPACRFRARDKVGPHGTAGRGKGNRKVLNREQE